MLAIVCDNASANTKLIETINADLSLQSSTGLQKAHRIFPVYCFAHVAHRVINVMLPVLQDFIKPLRSYVVRLHHSTSESADLERIIKTKNLFCKADRSSSRLHCFTIPKDVPTRWNSTHIMIKQAIRIYKHCGNEFLNLCHMSHEQFEVLENFATFLEVFAKVSQSLTNTHQTTMSRVLPSFNLLLDHLETTSRNITDSTFAKVTASLKSRLGRKGIRLAALTRADIQNNHEEREEENEQNIEEETCTSVLSTSEVDYEESNSDHESFQESESEASKKRRFKSSKITTAKNPRKKTQICSQEKKNDKSDGDSNTENDNDSDEESEMSDTDIAENFELTREVDDTLTTLDQDYAMQLQDLSGMEILGVAARVSWTLLRKHYNQTNEIAIFCYILDPSLNMIHMCENNWTRADVMKYVFPALSTLVTYSIPDDPPKDVASSGDEKMPLDISPAGREVESLVSNMWVDVGSSGLIKKKKPVMLKQCDLMRQILQNQIK